MRLLTMMRLSQRVKQVAEHYACFGDAAIFRWCRAHSPTERWEPAA